MSTLTAISTRSDGMCMPSVPKQQSHCRKTPTLFEGNNKSATTSGSTTTFKNWASELQIYMSLEDRNITHIIEHELEKQKLSTHKAERRLETELQKLRQTCNNTHRQGLQRNAAKKAKTRNEPDDEVLLYLKQQSQADKLPNYLMSTSHSTKMKERLSTWKRSSVYYKATETTQADSKHGDSYMQHTTKERKQLHTLNRTMNPTWNNVTQQANELMRQFKKPWARRDCKLRGCYTYSHSRCDENVDATKKHRRYLSASSTNYLHEESRLQRGDKDR
eukprot:6466782-Amphidinium_carterae.1